MKDNYLIYLQFKIINRILGTKSLLDKISLTYNPLCILCKEQEETIMHLFYDCNEALLLWQTVCQWISTKLDTHLQPEKKSWGFDLLWQWVRLGPVLAVFAGIGGGREWMFGFVFLIVFA